MRLACAERGVHGVSAGQPEKAVSGETREMAELTGTDDEKNVPVRKTQEGLDSIGASSPDGCEKRRAVG